MIDGLLALASRVVAAVTSVPWGVHAAAALLMVAGLVLWLCGQRILKPLMIGGAVVMGAGLGAVAAPHAGLGASVTAWHGLILGSVAGVLVGVMLHRSTMAIGFGLVLGAALPLIAGAGLHFQPLGAGADAALVERMPERPESVAAQESGEPSTPAGADEIFRRLGLPAGASLPSPGAATTGLRLLSASWTDDGEYAAAIKELELGLHGAAPGSKTDASQEVAPMPENLRPAADAVSGAWAEARARAEAGWAALPPSSRAVVGLTGIIGLAGGIIAGLLLPAWAGGAVTSLLGSGLWLSCFAWLSAAMAAPWRGVLDRPLASWVVVWAVLGVIGTAVQWRSLLKRRRAATEA